MRYNFSSDFVKVISPDTSFGDAWETICYTLLKCEYGETDIIALKAPDKGIDIWRPTPRLAYQCKSNENGCRGSVDISKAISSCDQAIKARTSFPWKTYFLAFNASVTGSAYAKLMDYCKANDVAIEILTAEYWSELAGKHISAIEQYLDYRLLLSEADVKRAFEKARYYDEYVKQFTEQIQEAPTTIRLCNNRSPVVFEFTFSLDLTIEELLEFGKSVFHVDMQGKEFTKLLTSAKPSISILYNGVEQPFSKRLCDVIQSGNNEFTFWIKIVWKDHIEDKTVLLLETVYDSYARSERGNNSGEKTIALMEAALQDDIWKSEFVSCSAHN